MDRHGVAMTSMDEASASVIHIGRRNVEPEDGRLTSIDLDDKVSTTAFTPFGVENLKELLADLNQLRPQISSSTAKFDHCRGARRTITSRITSC
jgi:hypothetical protein